MTNFEKMMKGETFSDKGLTLKEVGKILCIGMQFVTKANCDECPFAENCALGQCGAEEFLKKKFISID
jgi:adenine-specific DNA glycosylase